MDSDSPGDLALSRASAFTATRASGGFRTSPVDNSREIHDDETIQVHTESIPLTRPNYLETAMRRRDLSIISVRENRSTVFPIVEATPRMELGISLSYYDKILAAIAASLGGGALAGVITTFSFRVGLLIGALFATLFVYDAMFHNPPPSPQAKAATLVWHVFLGILLVSTYL